MGVAANLRWVLVAGLAALYVLTSVRVALSFRRTGRNPVAWFFITLFFTAVPAAVYMAWCHFRHGGQATPDAADSARAKEDLSAARRCRHCGTVITDEQRPAPAGIRTCPNCRLPIEEDHLA